MQVARSSDPQHDVDVVAAICDVCAGRCAVRADANRRWTFEQALRFAEGLAARGAALEYLEEPVHSPRDIERFARAAAVPVAVDESLDDGSFLPQLVRALPGAVPGAPAEGVIGAAAAAAVVIKPAVLGSMERICTLLRWGASHGVRCVLSSAFEGPVGIAKLAAVAAAADALCAERAAGASRGPTAHGLGTLPWFAAGEGEGGVATDWLQVRETAAAGGGTEVAGLRLEDTEVVEGHALAMHAATVAGSAAAPQGSPDSSAAAHFESLIIHAQEPGGPAAQVRALRLRRQQDGSGAPSREGKGLLLFLHGFMGSAEDWRPVMLAMAQRGYECAAIDLPGHGDSTWGDACVDPATGACCDIPAMAAVVRAALRGLLSAGGSTPPGPAAVIGYSLGARVALQVAAEPCANVERVVSVSGSPGIQLPHHAEARRMQDQHTADLMHGMEAAEFVDVWYQAPLWASLRQHPRFDQISERRRAAGDMRALGNVLLGCTPGRQNLWSQLAQRRMACDVSLVVGEWDAKFVQVAKGIAGLPEDWEPGDGGAAATGGAHAWPGDLQYPVVEVMHAGHAVHEEQPLALVNALRQLLG